MARSKKVNALLNNVFGRNAASAAAPVPAALPPRRGTAAQNAADERAAKAARRSKAERDKAMTAAYEAAQHMRAEDSESAATVTRFGFLLNALHFSRALDDELDQSCASLANACGTPGGKFFTRLRNFVSLDVAARLTLAEEMGAYLMKEIMGDIDHAPSAVVHDPASTRCHHRAHPPRANCTEPQAGTLTLSAAAVGQNADVATFVNNVCREQIHAVMNQLEQAYVQGRLPEDHKLYDDAKRRSQFRAAGIMTAFAVATEHPQFVEEKLARHYAAKICAALGHEVPGDDHNHGEPVIILTAAEQTRPAPGPAPV